MKVTYAYPKDGSYNETIATINGQGYIVNGQYETVSPVYAPINHAENCEIIPCTCGAKAKFMAALPEIKASLMEGIDIAALIVDARINGKFGWEPKSERVISVEEEKACEAHEKFLKALDDGYGDAQANR